MEIDLPLLDLCLFSSANLPVERLSKIRDALFTVITRNNKNMTLKRTKLDVTSTQNFGFPYLFEINCLSSSQ